MHNFPKVELASLGDLLCLEGLKEVVSKELLLKHCHSFHSPCTASLKTKKNNEHDGGCIEGILEVLMFLYLLHLSVI